MIEKKDIDKTPPRAPAPPKESPPPKRFWSPQLAGFFSSDVHGDNLPKDAVAITDAEWRSLLDQQNEGKQIVTGQDGKPVTIDPVITPAMKRRAIQTQIDQLRRASDTLDLQRAAALGTPGAKEQLQAVDNQIQALRATLPPLPASGGTSS